MAILAFTFLVVAGNVIPNDAAAGIDDRITVTGDVRARWLQVDVDGPSLTGIYGEALKPQTSFFHRFFLTVEGQVNRHVTAGGLLRVSNEPDNVLLLGPHYFSRPEGSAFVAMRYGNVHGRIGYYDVHFTPLTLMRWDMADIALGGTQRACGVCGGTTAAVLIESLEEPGPDLTFEGARAGGTVGEGLDWTVLYARPKEATLDRVPGLPIFDEDTFQHHQDLYAGRAVYSQLHDASLTFRRVGATVMHVRDDPRNPGCPTVETDPLCFAMMNTAFGLDARVPIARFATLEGEWLRTAQRDDHRGDASRTRWSNGFRATAHAVLAARTIGVRLAYLRFEEHFSAPYSALTYLGNRSGLRARVTAERGPLTVDTFVRRLEPIEPESADPQDLTLLDSELTASFQVSAEMGKGWQILAGAQFERTDIVRESGCDCDYRSGERWIGLGELSFTLDELRLSILHQVIREDQIDLDESDATITSVSARARF